MKDSIKIRCSGGEITAIYNDKLRDLLDDGGSFSIRRVSNVEPEGDTWTADLRKVGGPVLRGFKLRQEALDAEIKWIDENVISVVLEQMGEVQLHPGFWDCECKEGYVHHNGVPACFLCNTEREEQPHSRADEVFAMFFPEPEATPF